MGKGAADNLPLRQVRGFPARGRKSNIECISQDVAIMYLISSLLAGEPAGGAAAVLKGGMAPLPTMASRGGWPRYKGHMVDALALEVDEGRGQLR